MLPPDSLALLFGRGSKQGALPLTDGLPCTPARLAAERHAARPDDTTAAGCRREVDDALGGGMHMSGLLSSFAHRLSFRVAAIGIDPGLSGAAVAVDAYGAHLWTVRIGKLARDESPDGPDAVKRDNARRTAYNDDLARRRAAGEPTPNERKEVMRKAKTKGARPRLDPLALGWLCRVLAVIGCPVAVEGLLYLNIDIHGSAARRGQSRQSSATTDENHGRIIGALGGAGCEPEIVPPKDWQRRWSCETTFPQWTSKFTATRPDWERPRKFNRVWRLVDAGAGRLRASEVIWDPTLKGAKQPHGLTGPKLRSIVAARRAGLLTRDDAEADAYGIARWALANA